MTPGSTFSRACDLFATLLEYPHADPSATAEGCGRLVAPISPRAHALLVGFAGSAAALPLGSLQEMYSSVFELNASCHPYVGYHLFGESYKRSAFMVRLSELYRAQRFNAGPDLPDHLAVMLRFLAVNTDVDQANVIISEALLPTLGKMVGPESEQAGGDAINQGGDETSGKLIYMRVLRALQQALQAVETGTEPSPIFSAAATPSP